ncbi:protein Star-like [Neocloeon triangulifer]|uniref:protein Star-like n=1 Tax=Neocloeon triangulifer TaxID=2078957 RepID=UPI00286F712D|nr:protein Star-like [Neocloeon triangulifer]
MQVLQKYYCLFVGTIVFFVVFLMHQHCKRDESLREQLENDDIGSKKNYDGLDEYDKKLMNHAKNILIKPNGHYVPYVLGNPNGIDYSQEGTAIFIHSLMKNKTNGYFVECGAYDGETYSNTLGLEKNFNWTGLLIEGAPKNIDVMLKKKRRAWIAPTCLSTKRKSMTVTFNDNINGGKIVDAVNGSIPQSKEGVNVDVFCVPFNTYMKVLDIKHIDYFSLDVEGHEYEILQTIDFKKVKIDVMVVEHFLAGNKSDGILRIMKENGFSLVKKMKLDFIFVHNGTSQ